MTAMGIDMVNEPKSKVALLQVEQDSEIMIIGVDTHGKVKWLAFRGKDSF
jgi:hypothetical protein